MDEDRALEAEWHFEADGDGYIYYAGTHSRGIRVSATEREAFISGSYGDWLDIIGDREATEPPRPFWPALSKRAGSLGREWSGAYIAIGIIALKKAYDIYDGLAYADSNAPLLLIAASAVGLLAISFGLLGLWVTSRQSRSDE